MTKVWRAKIDYGDKGTLMMDEIVLEGIGSSFLAETSINYLREWNDHLASIESHGLTYDFLPLAIDSLAIHETAISKIHDCFREGELLPIHLEPKCIAKLPDRFASGGWYAIRPITCIELCEESKVVFFGGSNLMIKEIQSYVFRSVDLNKVAMFRIKFDSYSYYVSESFVDCYKQAKLKGLRFIDTKCKTV